MCISLYFLQKSIDAIFAIAPPEECPDNDISPILLFLIILSILSNNLFFIIKYHVPTNEQNRRNTNYQHPGLRL